MLSTPTPMARLRNVVHEDVVVLLNILAHVRDKFAHALLEVRMDVSHHTANGVVVEDEAATASFFEDVKNLLAVAESIEEGCGRAEVLC